MNLCKVGEGVYQVIEALTYPNSQEIILVVIKDFNDNLSTVKFSEVTKVTDGERKMYEKILNDIKSRKSVPISSKPVGVYPQKRCNLPKTNDLYEFHLDQLSAKAHGGIEGMLPAVKWEFIGFCVKTNAKSLDLFQFDDNGKSAFQDNFFSHYDTQVSYGVEGDKHYACFTPTSEAIVSFVARYLKQQISTRELKKYMSYAEIDEYRHYREIMESELRMSLVRAQQPRSHESAHRLSAQGGIAVPLHAAATLSASRDMPVNRAVFRESPFASPVAGLRSAVTVPINASDEEFDASPAGQKILSAKRTLGIPLKGVITQEQECNLMHFMQTGNRPGQGGNRFSCIPKKSSGNS